MGVRSCVNDGWVPSNLDHSVDETLVDAARALRRLHDATAGSEVATGARSLTLHGARCSVERRSVDRTRKSMTPFRLLSSMPGRIRAPPRHLRERTILAASDWRWADAKTRHRTT
jgi:hypothetical protein